MISFTIPGKPQGKGRPRFSTRGGFVKSYTPQKTREYEEFIKRCYRESGASKVWTDKEPLAVTINAYYEIPKSTTKKDRAAIVRLELLPTKKPDIDNIAKVVLDALNGVAFGDDSQIVELSVNKYYAADEPGVDVVIKEIGG